MTARQRLEAALRRRRRGAIAALGLVATLPVAACAAQDRPGAGDPIALWQTGRYTEAIPALEVASSLPDAPLATRRAYVHALIETGRLDEAARAADVLAAAHPADAALRADVLAERGALADADQGWQAALAAHTPDSVRVLGALARAAASRGRWEAASALDDRIVAAVTGDPTPDASALIAAAGAMRRYGRADPARFPDALRLLDRAAARDAGDPAVQVALADLFLDKWNAPDARTAAAAALARNPSHPGALVAEARRRRFEQEPGADSLVRQALQVNAHHRGALTLAATLALDAEHADSATTLARRALAVDSADVDALGVLAAARLLAGDAAGVAAARQRALARNPSAGSFFVTLAELSARMRRYADAAAAAQEGGRVDPRSWRAHAVAGVNLLRLGQVDAARQALERAFAGDPYDVWTKNTLDLLDAYARFDERRTPRSVLLIEREEADLLAPYLSALVERGYDELGARYGWRPTEPIRLEVYRSHADFSVRTVGLAGLGALGVSFGNVLAMDSPAAREPGTFNWGSTAWHELAHAYTLGASDGRIPRWLSEGISVREERRARPGWGARPSPALFAAYADGSLPPPSRMNDAFARPASANALGLAYVLASLVVEYVEAEHGVEALATWVSAYRDGATTDAALTGATGLAMPQLDRGFDSWVRRMYAAGFAAGDGSAYVRALTAGRALLEAGRTDEAAAALERAVALFPEDGSPGGARWHLVRARLAAGDTTAALRDLAEHTARAETDVAANDLEATLRAARGEHAAAADALERIVWITPYDPSVHERLAVAAHAAGDHARAVRERRALVALRPTDEAGARYELAAALRDAGDTVGARREVLRSLELAPNFERAQDLLLELRAAPASPPPGAQP